MGELKRTIELVLGILNKHNIKIKIDKCTFFDDDKKFCGFIIDKNGIHKDQSKVKAMAKMPVPRKLTELRAFIRFVNYCGGFIWNLSEISYPLFKILRNGENFANMQRILFF